MQERLQAFGVTTMRLNGPSPAHRNVIGEIRGITSPGEIVNSICVLRGEETAIVVPHSRQTRVAGIPSRVES